MSGVSSPIPRVVRAVVDTNVLLRVLLSKAGPSARVYEAARRGDFRLVLSPTLLREIRAAFFKPHVRRRYPLSLGEIAAFMADLQIVADVVPGHFEVDLVPTDPKDNPVLACALEGRAGLLVTDDRRDLLPLGVVQVAGCVPVRIVNVPTFLRELTAGHSRPP